jgi:hypothetical protein
MSLKEDFIDDILEEIQSHTLKSTPGIVYKKHYITPGKKADLTAILNTSSKKRPAADLILKDDLWELNQVYHARKKQCIRPTEILIPLLKTTVLTCDIKQEGVRLISGGLGPTKGGSEVFKHDQPRTDYMVNAVTVYNKKRRMFKAHGEEYRLVDNKLTSRQSGLPYECEGVYIRYGKKLGRLIHLAPGDTLNTWYNRIYTVEHLVEKFKTFIPLLYRLKLSATRIYDCFLKMLKIHGYEKRDISFSVFQGLRVLLMLNTPASSVKPLEPQTRPRFRLKQAKVKVEHYRTHWDYGESYFAAQRKSVTRVGARPLMEPSTNAFLNRILSNESVVEHDSVLFIPPQLVKPFPICIEKAVVKKCPISQMLQTFLKQGAYRSYVNLIDDYEKTGNIIQSAGKFYTVSPTDGIDAFICCFHDYAIYKNANEDTYAVKRGGQTICKFCHTELSPAQDEIHYDASGQVNITSQDMFLRSEYVRHAPEFPELQQFLTDFYNTFTDYTQHLNKDEVVPAVIHYLERFYTDSLKENDGSLLAAKTVRQDDSAFLQAFTAEEKDALGLVKFESREKIKTQIKVFQLRRNFIRAGVLCAFAARALPDFAILLKYFKIDTDEDINSMGVKWNEFQSGQDLLAAVYERACIHTGFIPARAEQETAKTLVNILKQGATEKIPFAEAVNRIASGTKCSNEMVLMGYLTETYVLYERPPILKPQRNVPQSYIKLLQQYAENQALFDRKPERIKDVERSENGIHKWEPVKMRNGGKQAKETIYHSYPPLFQLSLPDLKDLTDLTDLTDLKDLTSLKLNLKFINQLDDIPVWVKPSAIESTSHYSNDLLETLTQLTGQRPMPSVSSMPSESDLKVLKLQTIGKELIYFHSACTDMPELRLTAYRAICPEIFSYGKVQLDVLAKEKKCSSAYLLKLVLQTDVLFHAAKISQKLSDDKIPDVSILRYFTPKESNPYLRFIADHLQKRLTPECNHTIVEYDRYQKWFSQIKAPRTVRTLFEAAEDKGVEDEDAEDEDTEDTPVTGGTETSDFNEEDERIEDPDVELDD